MAEILVSSIVQILLDKLGSVAYNQQVFFVGSVKNDLQKLERILNSIKAVLLDAEEQQLHNHQVRVWLEQLKDVCYDAEYVLDEFEVEALRREVTLKRGSIRKKVCNFLSQPKSLAFRFKLGQKIKEIGKRFDEIAASKDKLSFKDGVPHNRINLRRDRETHSFMAASDIIGRDRDKEAIIKSLMQSGDGKNASVIPIVGIAGLGKTALAKLVYNDKRIDEYFDLKLWVCVSNDFVEKKMIIDIISSATDQKCSDMNIDQLQKVLRDVLDGKKYLLVLDDVWNEDVKKWVEFKSLLLGGVNESKIIVTTRNSRVASIMSTMRGDSGGGYHLQGLPYDSCLSLFIKCAFKEEDKDPNLKKIGEEIVKKCRGVPLAVKTLGSLLYPSNDENDWKYVRDNELWDIEQKEDDILPALKLSYDQLPPYLKQCFAFCSIFPKDFEFDSLFLVQAWMANKLLHSRNYNGNEELEIIGMRYLKELVSRSFFQDFRQLPGGFFTFKMHDLMHDLAVLVAKNECAIVNSPTQFISKNVRHLSFFDDNTFEGGLPSFLSNLGHLSTIFFPFDDVKPNQSFIESCISMFPFLRTLEIRYSDIELLPKKLGNMRHLRYLHLGENNRMKTLPNSICNLQSLQTLSLEGCKQLQELPRDIRYLISLRTLLLSTNQKRLPEKGIGSLNSLRFLQISSCGNLECLFEDIGNLKALRTLIIVECPSLVSLPRRVKELSSLENLCLWKCEKLNLSWRMEMEEQDNSTRPHLRTLSIGGLPQLIELPQWLLQCSANTLQWLAMKDCPNFIALPESLQHLETLQVLRILDCPKVSSLPQDMHRLTALGEFGIQQCPALSERCKKDTGEDWPKIAHVPKIYLDGNWIKSN
ncbi:hypothetical protein JRO89_XS11G0076700 [Xanthoceras sorbifolium]|uniref:Uncharacterized protein n=1 Tax=Xanthoceras sorbifolium TaxID=99658 RepID=A0ABQ8HF14_9ROSI|nr:hypothetical protein JRO89_XS11G0076700 [Xanthoceras sorbifolium]